MNIQEKIKKWIKETLKIKEDFILAHPKDIKNGDYSFFYSTARENDFGKILNENKILEIERQARLAMLSTLPTLIEHMRSEK